MQTLFRIVFWNIMAGGGKRADAIAAQIQSWNADVVALAEFRATPPSRSIATSLHEHGLTHQLTTANTDHQARNALLLASRYPLKNVIIKTCPQPLHRWLLATVQLDAPFHIGVMHIPNMHTGLKVPYHEAVLTMIRQWRHGAGLLVGDTNSGLPDIDEEAPAFTKKEAAFMNAMDADGWRDMFRVLHGDQRAYSWYSPNGRNGFRLDQAFVNTHLIAQVESFRYIWGTAEGHRQLSDHAAIIMDMRLV